MKRFLLFAIIAFVLLLAAGITAADETPAVVVITAQPAESEPAVPVPYDQPTEHELSYADVERLARLAWSSPLSQLRQKKALMWAAVNRVGVEPYGDTLAEVVNTVEFPYYDKRAHVSEENEALARKVLNEWLSEQDGLWIDRLVPRSGVMVRFIGDNRKIQVLDKNGNCVWEAS